MQFSPLITEQTTAASDAVLAVIALACALGLRTLGGSNPWRARIWSIAFGLLSLAAALGTVVHTFQWSPGAKTLLWQPLYLTLGLTMSLFVVGVADDVWGRRVARRALPVMIGVAVAFYLLTVLVPNSFLLFALFELAAMVFAVAGYGWLTLRDRRAHFAWMAAGMASSIFAAVMQTQHSVSLTLIWEFDHNGIFHLIQIPALLFLMIGLCQGFRAHAPGPPPPETS